MSNRPLVSPQALMPEYEDAIHLRESAEKLMDAVASEKRGEGRKARMETELNFIREASGAIIHKFACLRAEYRTKFAEELSDGEGVDVIKEPKLAQSIVYRWAEIGLEQAGIGNLAEKEEYDEEDAEEMVFVPDATFDAILIEAAAQFRSLLNQN